MSSPMDMRRPASSAAFSRVSKRSSRRYCLANLARRASSSGGRDSAGVLNEQAAAAVFRFASNAGGLQQRAQQAGFW